VLILWTCYLEGLRLIMTFAILSGGTFLGLFFRSSILLAAIPGALLLTWLAGASETSSFLSVAPPSLLNETVLQLGYLFGAMLRPLVMSAQIEGGLGK
jgi:hypothetical protein